MQCTHLWLAASACPAASELRLPHIAAAAVTAPRAPSSKLPLLFPRTCTPPQSSNSEYGTSSDISDAMSGMLGGAASHSATSSGTGMMRGDGAGSALGTTMLRCNAAGTSSVSHLQSRRPKTSMSAAIALAAQLLLHAAAPPHAAAADCIRKSSSSCRVLHRVCAPLAAPRPGRQAASPLL